MTGDDRWWEARADSMYDRWTGEITRDRRWREKRDDGMHEMTGKAGEITSDRRWRERKDDMKSDYREERRLKRRDNGGSEERWRETRFDRKGDSTGEETMVDVKINVERRQMTWDKRWQEMRDGWRGYIAFDVKSDDAGRETREIRRGEKRSVAWSLQNKRCQKYHKLFKRRKNINTGQRKKRTEMIWKAEYVWLCAHTTN